LESGVRVWSYKGKPAEFTGYGFRRVNHRRFEHLFAVMREGRWARITDSTHFHLEYPNFILLPLWICAKFLFRFTWLKILHDGSLPSRYEQFGFLRRRLFYLAIWQIDEFIIYNRDLEKWLHGEIKVKQKINFIDLVLPSPPNWGEKQPDERFATPLRRFSRRERRVCSIGAFIPSYGFLDVAEAVEKLRSERNEDIGLLLVDGTFARDENFRAMVLLNRDWIEIVEDVPHQQIPNIFRQCDVFVRSFEHESYGLSRIEAIWCGTPVIATNVGETRGMLAYEFGNVALLCDHLNLVFDGKLTIDHAKWAAVFHNEAKENLDNYLRLIAGDNGQTNAD
jgi:glycosyltransferase involved in cell wall biosynthesis